MVGTEWALLHGRRKKNGEERSSPFPGKCSDHLEEIELQIAGLVHAPEDGVVAGLLPGLDLPQLHAGIPGGVVPVHNQI